MSIKALTCSNVSVEIFHAAYSYYHENLKPANKGFPTIKMKEDTDNVLCSCVLITSPHTPSLHMYITSRVTSNINHHLLSNVFTKAVCQIVTVSCLSFYFCQKIFLYRSFLVMPTT